MCWGGLGGGGCVTCTLWSALATFIDESLGEKVVVSVLPQAEVLVLAFSTFL